MDKIGAYEQNHNLISYFMCGKKQNCCNVVICGLRSEEKFGCSSTKKLTVPLFSSAVWCFCWEAKGFGADVTKDCGWGCIGGWRDGGKQRFTGTDKPTLISICFFIPKLPWDRPQGKKSISWQTAQTQTLSMNPNTAHQRNLKSKWFLENIELVHYQGCSFMKPSLWLKEAEDTGGESRPLLILNFRLPI